MLANFIALGRRTAAAAAVTAAARAREAEAGALGGGGGGGSVSCGLGVEPPTSPEVASDLRAGKDVIDLTTSLR